MNALLKTDSRYEIIRQKILDESYQIVQHKGIDQLSMRTIASAVKSSPANLYEYFACKEEIVYELYSKLLSDLAEHLTLIDAHLSPDDYLEQLGIAYLEFAQNHAALFKLQGQNKPESSFSISSQPVMNCDDDNQRPVFRSTALYEILYHAVERQSNESSMTSAMSMPNIHDRTLAFWSLLHGYVSLLALTNCSEYSVRTWKRLYQQLFLHE
jgi:AcrR family transcriptional regulator